jgi:hypothetical protein
LLKPRHTLLQVATIEEPLKTSKLVGHLLTGLDSDYNPLVTSITTRVDLLSLEELYGDLLSHEQRILQQTIVVDLSVASVNLAHKNSSTPIKNQRSLSGNSSRGRGRG